MKQMGMKKAHREHVIRNMATSLLLYESIVTTETKAKELKSYVEKIISKAKKNDLHARRQIGSVLFDQNATKKLFSELILRYGSRNSGFTRTYRLGTRVGDNATKIRVDLIDKKVFAEKAEAKSEKKKDVTAEKKLVAKSQ